MGFEYSMKRLTCKTRTNVKKARRKGMQKQMREENRLFGNNMRYFMYHDNVTIETLAKDLNYSETEVLRIMGARVYVSLPEQKRIANYLKKDLSDFMVRRDSKEYENAGCYECFGDFSNPTNRDFIFNIFDLYCDVQEMIVSEPPIT